MKKETDNFVSLLCCSPALVLLYFDRPQYILYYTHNIAGDTKLHAVVSTKQRQQGEVKETHKSSVWHLTVTVTCKRTPTTFWERHREPFQTARANEQKTKVSSGVEFVTRY